MKKLILVYTIFSLFVFTIVSSISCSKDEISPPKPTKVNLVFPFENSECTGGTDTTETESTVLFEWSEGQNVDEYELNLKNLFSGDSSSYITNELSIPITILRATPYSWYILSKSNSTSKTAKSDIWRFYNAGEALTHYAPFPAEIVSPAMAETITTSASVITLEWVGSDVDGDIVAYDVYFGTTSPPDIYENDFTESILNSAPILSNTVYYWEIVTKDARGNSSSSGIYQFRVL